MQENLIATHSRFPLVVYGAGGHGAVIFDAAQAAGMDVRGFLDDGLPMGSRVLDVPVLGGLAWLEEHTGVGVAVGIGSNVARERIFAELRRLQVKVVTVIHPSAVISRHCRIGEGTVVLASAVVNAAAEIGIGAIVNTAAVIEHHVNVGDFAHVSPNATLAGAARLGRSAQLGVGACVLPGRSIGDHSTIGGGAVVTRDVPAGVTAYGVPAKARSRAARPP